MATTETTKETLMEAVEMLETDLFDQAPVGSCYYIREVEVAGRVVTLRGTTEALYWTQDTILPEGERVAVLDHTKPLYAVEVRLTAEVWHDYPSGDWFWEARAEVAEKAGAEAVCLTPGYTLTEKE